MVVTLGKEMATHSSVLAWRIPGMGEPVGCRLRGCTELDMTEATEQQQQQQQQQFMCVYPFSEAVTGRFYDSAQFLWMEEDLS